MTARKVKVVLIGMPIIVAAVGVALIIGRDDAVGARLVSVGPRGQEKEVTVDFTKRDRAVWFDHAPRVQVRRDGRWEPPTIFRELGPEGGLARTGSERVAFLFPPGTDACRFLIDYRTGTRPYCRAYFFLSKHGIMQRFPKLSRSALKLIPQNAGVRHFEAELVLSS
jgi:hypothetical protein